MRKKVKFRDLGVIDYKECWDYQTQLRNDIVSAKKGGREKNNQLIFCEHPHVFTIGKSGREENLLLNADQLKEENVDYYKINRGGDITYHGPGQIVAYPIFDLDEFFTDVHKYVRYLEEVVIKTLHEFNIAGYREEKYTGVWIKDIDGNNKRKICAIGVHLSRWVTMHGLAFNVNNDLSFFEKIIPCGIEDSNMKVTSLSKEIGIPVPIDKVKELLLQNFVLQYEFTIIKEENETKESS